ncbi:MAG: hypothetical protein ACFB0D_01335 [Phormidesmis sp.]
MLFCSEIKTLGHSGVTYAAVSATVLHPCGLH